MTHKRIANFNYVAICSFAAAFLLLFAYLSIGEMADDRANHRLADKAEALGLTGKPKEFLLANFGSPDYTRPIARGELFVYTPGPVWVLWKSECKVGIDSTTGLVDGWNINSD